MKNTQIFKSLERFTYRTSGCWFWIGSTNQKGYGRMGIGDGKVDSSHRVAYRLYKGAFRRPMQVLHACDTPNCVNPDHLFLGTNADNHRDAAKKGIGGSLHFFKTRCKYGHSFSKSNTYYKKNGARGCRECIRERTWKAYHGNPFR